MCEISNGEVGFFWAYSSECRLQIRALQFRINAHHHLHRPQRVHRMYQQLQHAVARQHDNVALVQRT